MMIECGKVSVSEAEVALTLDCAVVVGIEDVVEYAEAVMVGSTLG